MTTALVDYDSGNLHSAQQAFERMAAEVGSGSIIVTSDPDVVAKADRIVLPGDGAFPHCRSELFARSGLAEAIVEAVTTRARPFFGICVGMQMMATTGHEYEETPGFDWVAGDIRKITPSDPKLKVPHMGWNDLVIDHPHPVLEGISTGDHAYFVHSYHMALAGQEAPVIDGLTGEQRFFLGYGQARRSPIPPSRDRSSWRSGLRRRPW